jgi:hypothetical protein
MRLGIVVTAGAICAGCTSPESLRTRGGGAGADSGNRAEPVKMHGGSDPFWQTPDRIGDAHAPLDAALHARGLSRP